MLNSGLLRYNFNIVNRFAIKIELLTLLINILVFTGFLTSIRVLLVVEFTFLSISRLPYPIQLCLTTITYKFLTTITVKSFSTTFQNIFWVNNLNAAGKTHPIEL